jgi:hypothetical protein
VHGYSLWRGYVRHGVENPTLYRLMFGGSLSDPDDDRPAAIETAAAEKTKAMLADAIISGALGHPIANTAQNERMIAGALLIFWSQMHGLTLLLVDRLVGPYGNTDELAESVLQGMLDGLATRIPRHFGPRATHIIELRPVRIEQLPPWPNDQV